MANAMQRLSERLARIEEVFLGIAMLTMLGSTGLVILSRYISGLRLGPLTDLAVGLIPWVGMLGAAVALHRSRHIGVTFLRDALPQSLRSAVIALSAVVILSFLAVLFWSGAELVARQIASGVTTPALELPRWIISLAVPVGAGLAMLHQVSAMLAAPAPDDGGLASAHPEFHH